MKKKSAIIPYRFFENQLEILLIKNSSDTKWVIPKGTIEKPLKPSISATKEAYEEAGVLGVPHPIQIGTYHKNGQEVPTYLLEVSIELSSYREGDERNRLWHKVNELEKSIEDKDLLELLYIGVKVITKNKHYFKYAIQTFCNEHNVVPITITKKEASVKYKHDNKTEYIIDITRAKSTLAFSIKDKNKFESIKKIPNDFQTNALLDNSRSKMGYWSILMVNEGYRFTRMYNEELRVLNCELFLKILRTLAESCIEFENKMVPNNIPN